MCSRIASGSTRRLPWTSIVESVAAVASEDAIADSMNAQSMHAPIGPPFRNGQTRHRVNTPPVLWGLESGDGSIMTLTRSEACGRRAGPQQEESAAGALKHFDRKAWPHYPQSSSRS